MGAYLSQPNTTKTSSDGGNSSMSYGFSAMQGWRVSMEDAHNCIPDFDEETAMFAVYDGHGGEEVALYCSKYLPDIIKEQRTYKDGKLQKALEDAFLAIDGRITTEEVIKELVQISGRPAEEPPSEKVAEEDDLDTEEAALLHEEATMTIEELLVRYGQNLNAVKHAAAAAASGVAKKAASQNAEASKDKGEDAEAQKQGVNGEVEEKESDEKAKEGEAAPCGSKQRACRRTGGGEGSGSAESGESGSSNGEEKAGKAEGDAGPSCSSASSKAAGDAKSRFFDDSEESEEGEEEEEEGSDEEDGSDEEEADSSELEEEDTEEGEEDSEDEEEEEMCLPGMDGKEEPGSDSGTTAVVALIRGKQLIVANAGDSRCVVSERGDHFYKRNKSLPPEEQMISAMPDVKVLTLNEDHDFMVIACDGIWNVLSSQEVVDFISERIKPDQDGKIRGLSSIVEELLDHCLAPDTSGDGTGCDNMTCMIITFRPHPAQSDNAKKRKLQDEEADAAEENGNGKKAKSD
uniref:protein-serine/threonine phosphatase n=1 Tax=Fundulus heteroclitus TaxID=8078 RepID=A0A3Q2QKV7_FUNHE